MMKLVFALVLMLSFTGLEARVVKVTDARGNATININPDQLSPNKRVKFEIEFFEKLQEMDPTYGKNKPIDGDATVAIKKGKRKSVDKRHLISLGEVGVYGFHWLPPSKGKFNLELSIKDFNFEVEVIVGKWALEEVKEDEKQNLSGPVGVKGALIKSEEIERVAGLKRIKKVPGQRSMKKETLWGDRLMGYRLYKVLCLGLNKKNPAKYKETSYCKTMAKAIADPVMIAKANPLSWYKNIQNSDDGLDKALTLLDIADSIAYLQGFSIPLTDLARKATNYTLQKMDLDEKTLEELEKTLGSPLTDLEKDSLVWVLFKKDGNTGLQYFENKISNLDIWKKKDRVGYIYFGSVALNKRNSGAYAVFMETSGRILNVLGSTPKITSALKKLRKQGKRKKTKRFTGFKKSIARALYRDWKIHNAIALKFEQSEYERTWADNEFGAEE